MKEAGAETDDRSAERRKPTGLAAAGIDRREGEATATSAARVLRPEETILLHIVMVTRKGFE